MKKNILRVTAASLAMASLLSSCAVAHEEPVATFDPNSHSQNDSNTITVAIYPYIPDVPLMKSIVERNFKEIHPETELEFVDWDCYMEPDPKGIDVLMFDSMFLTNLVERNYIQPIELDDIDNSDGIFDYAIDGNKVDNELYGIPNLMCSYFLIHYKDDEAVAKSENIYQLHEALGNYKGSFTKPPKDKKGLVLNFADNFPYYYLDAMIDSNGEYTVYDEMPDLSAPSEAALKPLQTMVKMGGENQIFFSQVATWLYGTFKKAEWFGEGRGRAYYGYSEDMSLMGDIIDEIDLKPLSLSDKENHQLFFSDVVALSTGVTNEEKKEKCLELMNVMASEELLTELALGNGTPQYLLPTRDAVYENVEDTYPMYERLYELVTDPNNYLMRCGENIYKYQTEAYEKIPEYVVEE